MTTPKEEFIARLSAVLEDLNEDGIHDREAMTLLGDFAGRVVGPTKAKSWAEFKAGLSPKGYDALLETFRREGNAHHEAGRGKAAYALQALALSVVGKTQPDPAAQQGVVLLDQLIERARLLVAAAAARRKRA